MKNMTCPECKKDDFTTAKGLAAHRSILHGVLGRRKMAEAILRGGPNYATTMTRDFGFMVMAEIERLTQVKVGIEARIEDLKRVAKTPVAMEKAETSEVKP